MLTTSLLIIIMCAALTLYAVGLLFLPLKKPRYATSAALIHLASDDSPGYPSMWATDFPHDAPDEPLSVPDAHLTMQRHRACPAMNCGRKAAALRTLIDAGVVKPSTR